MIELTFSEFLHGSTSHGASLYVLHDGANVLYVGISRKDIWQRWFGDLSSHIGNCFGARPYGNSRAGRAVVANMPHSMNWTIELWSEEDCAKKFDSKQIKPYSESSLLEYEAEMIDLRRPSLNIMGVNYQQTKPQWELEEQERLLEAYRRAFDNEA